MDSLLSLAVGNAVAATVLAAIVAAVTWVVRRPAARHALWLLVLLKLLAPPLIPLPLMFLPSTGPTPSIAEPLPADSSPPSFDAPAEPAAIISTAEEDDASPESNPEPAAPTVTIPWQSVIVALWLCGSFAWWTIALLRVRQFHRLLHCARPAPESVQEQAGRLAALMGLRRCPPVVFVDAPLSPLLWALGFSPRLLLPAELWTRLSAEQRDSLLAHELAHLRRGDPWVRRLEFLVLGLYWWHPVAWWARRRLQEAEEECCDLLVLAVLPDAAPAYAAALVETVAFLSQTRTSAPLGASGVGQVPLLKRRLTMIMTANPSHRSSRAVWGMVFGLSLLWLLTPRGAQTDPPREPERAKTADSTRNAPPPPKPLLKLKEQGAMAVHVNRSSQESCLVCHTQLPTALLSKPQTWNEAHDAVIRLMREIEEKQAQLRQAEETLRRVLKQLNGVSFQRDFSHNHNEHFAIVPFIEPHKSGFKEQKPSVDFDIDFGTVERGKNVQRDYPLLNPFTRTVRIAGIRSSNACVKASAKKLDISPGEKATIHIELDTRRFTGDKQFTLFIRFEGDPPPELPLRIHAVSRDGGKQSPDRLQELERKLDALRQEIQDMRRQARPEKP